MVDFTWISWPVPFMNPATKQCFDFIPKKNCLQELIRPQASSSREEKNVECSLFRNLTRSKQSSTIWISSSIMLSEIKSSQFINPKTCLVCFVFKPIRSLYSAPFDMKSFASFPKDQALAFVYYLTTR